jgi:hypothetical protein
MPISAADLENWADTYIACQLDPTKLEEGNPLFWAAERLMIPETLEDAEECWACILRVLEKKPPEEVLEILSAGPLEDLIHGHGPQFIDRIEFEAKHDPDFRRLLAGVWESSTEEVWARVDKAVGSRNAV